MTTIPDHYAALGIDPTADPDVITAAYRALAKKFHPDTGAAGGTASAERFDAIQKAYEVLRSPETRHGYDLELLEATEQELAAHLATKRRVAVRERAAEQAAAASPPDLDLGDIRPQPAVPPQARAAASRKSRSLFPFAIPLLLMFAIGGAAAWVFLPGGPDAPSLPGTAPQVAAVAPKPAATETTPAAEATPDTVAAPDQQAPAQPPVFGSTATEDNPPGIEEAAVTPEPVPMPDVASGVGSQANPEANSAAKSDKPVFGSSGNAQAPAAAPATAPAPAGSAPPPLPKAKPAQPARPVAQQKPPQKPVQKKPVVQQQATLQPEPRARLQYQDPPQYYPEPDGYPPPPPGMEPPGYGPDPYAPPPGFRPPGGGPYRLVIFERRPGQPPTAWSAGVVFKSVGKCTRQGVKAVLRRTSGMDPYADNARVWYECQQLTQR
ncbi:MAG: DnaJ domain-containing protein [Alphaproteobacteria bacterium]|nr:DnaJ domain-containing protein [Alphaproteobacteria bacterium]